MKKTAPPKKKKPKQNTNELEGKASPQQDFFSPEKKNEACATFPGKKQTPKIPA